MEGIFFFLIFPPYFHYCCCCFLAAKQKEKDMEIEVHSGDYLAQLQRDYPDATLSDIVFPGELLWYIDSGGDNDEFFRSAWYCGYAGYDLDWDGAGCTTSDFNFACQMLDAGFEVRVA